jgi:uncharacterized RDD family membrane protein YckC
MSAETMSVETLSNELQRAGLFRRLGAMTYDGVVLIGVLAIATLPFVPLLNGRVMVPEEVGALAYAYWLWQAGICTIFFAFFWTRPRGQTLGMQAWRLRVEREDGGAVSWAIALQKIALLWLFLLVPLVSYWMLWRDWSKSAFTVALVLSLAPLLAAYVSIWLSRDRLTWHDRWTRTRVVVLPKL